MIFFALFYFEKKKWKRPAKILLLHFSRTTTTKQKRVSAWTVKCVEPFDYKLAPQLYHEDEDDYDDVYDNSDVDVDDDNDAPTKKM